MPLTTMSNKPEINQPNYVQIPQGYLIPMSPEAPRKDISLYELWQVLVEYKRLIAAVVIVCFVTSVITAMVVTPVYKAEVLLAPAGKDNSKTTGIEAIANQFGGLASLAGFSVGGGGIETAIATLKSRKFIVRFISDLGLKPILFENQWDKQANKWVSNKPLYFGTKSETNLGATSGEPTPGRVYKKFRNELLNVSQDKKTQLITVSVEWKNSQQAAEWANALVKRLNDELRQNTIDEAERSIAYLTEQIGQTSLSELQNVLYRIIEEHTKVITLAKVNDEYVMKVIDPAVPPEVRSKPKRTLIVVLGLFFGVMMGVIMAFFLHTIHNWRDQKVENDG